METDYERGYKDGMAGAALPNIMDNGDKIDGYIYSYKTDSEGVPYINIDSVRAMLTKAASAQRHGWWTERAYDRKQCTYCGKCEDTATDFCPNCGADMRGDVE